MGRTARVLVIAVWFPTGLSVAQSAAKQPQPVPRQVTLGRVLSWLPADTEVVLGASGPFPFPDLAAIPPPSSGELSPAEIALRAQFNLPLSLFQLNNGELKELLKDKRVALAIEGSRHFRPAPLGGAMRFEGCAIVVLESGAAVDGDPRAVGVTFYFEPLEHKQALITYLSATEDYPSVLLDHRRVSDSLPAARSWRS